MKRYLSPRQRRIRRFFTVLIAVFFVVLLCFLHGRVTALLLSVAETKLRALAVVSANDAARAVMDESGYEELVEIRKNEEGEITAITANTPRINAIARDCAYLTQKTLSERSAEGVEIPLGAFTGFESLAGFGPSVSFKTISVVGVTSGFASEFTSAGINQTRHAIYVVISSELSVVLPTGNRTFSEETQVLVCESIIVGKVPEVYLNGDLFG